jgi:hypothetical protein
MIARTRPVKKEKLKDIIDAVAAKESLLKPLPAAMPERTEQGTLPEERSSVKTVQEAEAHSPVIEHKRTERRNIRPLWNFWNGFCWGLGAITAVTMLVLAAVYLSTKLMLLSDLVGMATTVLSFILGIISSWNF